MNSTRIRWTGLLALVGLFGATGCGSCGGPPAGCKSPTVIITSPVKGATIDPATDDTNAQLAGTQITVQATVDKCVEAGSSANVLVNNDTNRAVSAQVTNHQVDFTNVTLVPADAQGNLTLTVSVRDRATGLVGKATEGVVLKSQPGPSCHFIKPTAGATLGASDDVDPATPGFQYDVQIACDTDLTGTVANLTIEGAAVPSTTFAGKTATFSGVTLSEGSNTLAATVAAQSGPWTGQVQVTVSTPACEVRLQPAGPVVFNIDGSTPRLPNHVAIADADGDPTNGIQAALTASTPDCQGGDAVLVVNGTGANTVSVTGTTVDFGNVTLPTPNGNPATNPVDVWVEVRQVGGTGPTGRSVTESYIVDGVQPVPVIKFPGQGGVVGPADDTDGNIANGIQTNLRIEVPGLASNSNATAGDGALIEATLTDGTGNATTLTCLVGIDGCADPATPGDYLLPMDLATDQSWTVAVTVTAPSGNAGTDGPIDFTSSSTQTQVQITSPGTGDMVNLGTPGVTGSSIPITISGGGLPSGSPVTVLCTGAAAPAQGNLDASGNATVNVDFGSAPCSGVDASCTATVTANGTDTTSAAVTFHVDLTAPTVSIVAPQDGSTVYDSSVNVEVVSQCLEDGQQVTVTTASGKTGSAAASGNAAVVPLTLASGQHTLTATATDKAGNPGTSSPVTITVDANPPNVVFVSPTDGIVFTGADDSNTTKPGFQHDVTVQVANKAAGTDVSLYIGYADAGTTVWRAPLGPVQTSGAGLRATFAGVDLPEGAFQLRAVATGPSGLKGSKTISVTVQTGATSCNIVSPVDGTSLGAAADQNSNPADGIQYDVRVRTSAADGATVALTLVDGTGTSQSLTASATGGVATFSGVSFTTAANSQTGTNTLDATCDTTGASPGNALTSKVEVDLEPPAAQILSPANGFVFNAASLDQSAMTGFQIQFSASATNPSDGSSVKVGSTGELDVTCGGTDLGTQTLTFDTYQGVVQAQARPTLTDQTTCTLSFVAIDLAGNRSTPATVQVRVDRVPPVLTITGPTDGRLFGKVDDLSAGTPGFQNNVVITYSGVEDGQPVQLFFTRLSSGGTQVEDPSSPHLVGAGSRAGFTFSNVTFTPQTDDQVTIEVAATDSAGNVTTASIGVTVDMTAPQVSITRPTNADPCYNLLKDFDTSTPGIQIQVNVDTAGVADGLPLTLCSTTATGNACSGAGFFQAAQSTVTGNTAYFPSVTMADGTQQLVAEVQDAAGNSNTSAPVTVCADSIPPSVTAHTIPADTNGDGTINAAELSAAGGTLCFDFSVTGADGQTLTLTTNNPAAGTVVGTGVVTGGAAQVCGSLAEGGHTLTATVSDVNGNPNIHASNPTIADPQAQFTLNKDTTPPVLDITDPAAGVTVLNGTTDPNPSTPDYELTFTVSSDAAGQTVTFSVDGASVGTGVVTGGVASVATTLTNNMTHTLSATVTDTAGNSTTTSRTVDVDTTPPTVAITSPADGSALNTNSVDLTIQVGGSAAGNQLTVVRTDTATPQTLATTTVAATQPQTVTVNIPDGTATLVAYAMDTSGNQGQSTPLHLDIITVGCSIVFTAPASSPVTFNIASDTDTATAGLQTTLVANTSDCMGQTITLLKNGTQVSQQASNATTGDASFPVTLNDGETGTFTAQMTDIASNVTSVTFSFSVDITPPGLTWTAPADAKVAYVTSTNLTVGTVVGGYMRTADAGPGAGAQAAMSFDVTGANGGQLVLTLGATTVYSTAITADPQTVAPTVTLAQDSAGTLTATLTDAAGNPVTATRDILVDVVAPAAPTVTPTLTDTRRATVGLTWSAVGDDGAATGTPTSYEVKWANSPITDEATYAAANLFTSTAGTTTTATLTPLPPLNTYSIAVRAKDELDNISPITVGTDIASQANMWTETTIAGQGSQYGFSMLATAADLNNDGYDDIVTSAYTFAGGGTQRGAVYIYYGGTNPAALTSQTILGQTDGEGIGYRLAAGDINGDGIPDLIVSADGYNAGQGRAFIYFGVNSTTGTTQINPATAIELRGTPGTGDFGRSFAVLGDINGDGIPDLAVSARKDGPNLEGEVYIYFGRSTASWQSAATAGGGFIPTSAADVALIGSTTDGQFGYRFGFANLGDIDGDGKDDFAIPQLGPTFGTNPQSSLYIYRAADVLAAAQPVPTSVALQHLVVAGATGLSFDGMGFSADGTNQYLVATDTKTTPPQVDLYALTASGATTPPLQAITQYSGSLNFGWSVTYGDLTGDGLADLVVGSNGTATNEIYLYPNTGTSPYFAATPPGTVLQRTGLGPSVWVGDVNGDGKRDLAAGAPRGNGGNGYVYIWW